MEFDIPHRKESFLSHQLKRRNSLGSANPHVVPRMTSAEEYRYSKVRRISPFWYGTSETCFYNRMDRIVILTDEDMGLIDAEIAGLRKCIKNTERKTISQFVDIGDQLYEIIHTIDVAHGDFLHRGSNAKLGYEYAKQYPNAKLIVALAKVSSDAHDVHLANELRIREEAKMKIEKRERARLDERKAFQESVIAGQQFTCNMIP